MTDTAKVFWTGDEQAVRLPRAYRFEGEEVRISYEAGRVILEDMPATLAHDAAQAIERLRAAIDEGEKSGEPEPWDTAEILRVAREQR